MFVSKTQVPSSDTNRDWRPDSVFWKQFARGNPQSLCDGKRLQNRDIADATLNPRHVRTVHSGSIGEGLLGKLSGAPESGPRNPALGFDAWSSVPYLRNVWWTSE
jgi:hypothetical protein